MYKWCSTRALKLSCALKSATQSRSESKSSEQPQRQVKPRKNESEWWKMKWLFLRCETEDSLSNYPFSMSFVTDNMPAENPTKSIQYTRHLPYICIYACVHSYTYVARRERLPSFRAKRRSIMVGVKSFNEYNGKRISVTTCSLFCCSSICNVRRMWRK